MPALFEELGVLVVAAGEVAARCYSCGVFVVDVLDVGEHKDGHSRGVGEVGRRRRNVTCKSEDHEMLFHEPSRRQRCRQRPTGEVAPGLA